MRVSIGHMSGKGDSQNCLVSPDCTAPYTAGHRDTSPSGRAGHRRSTSTCARYLWRLTLVPVISGGTRNLKPRVLAITPVRDEVGRLEAMAASVVGQTRRPDRWLIADDGSTDGTRQLAERLTSTLDWADVLDSDPAHTAAEPDRLAVGAVPRVLNRALAAVAAAEPYTHVIKLDGDVLLPRDYIERLLAAFAARPALGIYGGIMAERFGGGWRVMTQPKTHAPPPARMWSVACLEAIGSFCETLGWDTIDEVYARMHGFETAGDPSLQVRHQRPEATAQGAMRGRARQGVCAYMIHQPPGWMLLRTLKSAVMFRPLLVGGLAFAWGYADAHRRGVDRVGDVAFRRFVRAELRGRLHV